MFGKDMDGPFSFQYFGSPMVCEQKEGQSDEKFSSHCWKHGTSLIDNLHIVKNAPCLPETQYPFDKVRIRILNNHTIINPLVLIRKYVVCTINIHSIQV